MSNQRTLFAPLWGRSWGLFFLVGVLAMGACARPEAPNKPPGSMPSSAPSSAPLVADTAPAIPSTTPTSTPSKPADPPSEQADFCSDNAGCGWNDPCLPTRCVSAKRSPGLSACDESSPPPGECLCLESYCTLKPERPPAPVALGCTEDRDCRFEASRGTCTTKGEYPPGPIHSEGAFCRCEPASGACSVEWVGPVACKSYKDCSWSRSPLRPVPSSLLPRPNPKPVKACSTGEVDSLCVKNVCVIVGWSC